MITKATKIYINSNIEHEQKQLNKTTGKVLETILNIYDKQYGIFVVLYSYVELLILLHGGV